MKQQARCRLCSNRLVVSSKRVIEATDDLKAQAQTGTGLTSCGTWVWVTHSQERNGGCILKDKGVMSGSD